MEEIKLLVYGHFRGLKGGFASRIARKDSEVNSLALTGDAAAVARDCNTSVKEVLGEYKNIRTITGEMVTAKLAEAWFALLPAAPSNVLQAQFRF